MAQENAGDTLPVRVLRVHTMVQADGRVAIGLETREAGLFIFEVNQHAIDTLRARLTQAETFLRQSGGKA
jgi:hypothetical protein